MYSFGEPFLSDLPLEEVFPGKYVHPNIVRVGVALPAPELI
jgi:hypothetical protein